jgi:hypothetical protein
MFLETRKGAPTMRAGTPDGGHLAPLLGFAKGIFGENGPLHTPRTGLRTGNKPLIQPTL